MGQEVPESGKGSKEEDFNEARILKWEGPVPLPPIPETNYASFVLNVLGQHGDNVALVDAATGKFHTYGDVCRIVPRIQRGLADAGVGAGEAVVLITTNHIDFPLVMFAVILGYATCVPVSPDLTPGELSHVIQMSKSRWVVAHERAVGVVEEAFALLPKGLLRQMWVIGHVPERPSLADLMRTKVTEPSPSTDEILDPSLSVAVMPFSSGTTGLPKGVMLSHRNLLTAFLQAKYVREIRPAGSPNILECTLLVLPVYHIYGYTILISCLTAGGRAIMLPKFTPEKYFEAIQTHKVTYSPIVPHIARFLTQTPLLHQYDLSSLKAFASGSAPLPTATMLALMQKSGKGAGVGYGMTESPATIAVNGGPTGFQLDSVGRLLPYYEAKVVDVVSGDMVGEGREGEVCLRGPSVMLGYAGDPESTAAAIDSEGWLHTGDLGFYNSDNFLFLTDRIKDLIKVKGYQVSPSELEKILRSVEGVAEVAVVGVPDDRLGEAPRAYVVPLPGVTLDLLLLQQNVADRVVSYKQLAGGIEVVNSLPKNRMGKVLKRQLKKNFLNPKAKL